MNTSQEDSYFETILEKALDDDHVYILEAVAGRSIDTHSGIPHIWAHIRRRIHDTSNNENRWIYGVRITSTSEDVALIAEWIGEQQEKASKRIRTILREGVRSYVGRNGTGNDCTGNTPTDAVVASATEIISIAQLPNFTDEESPSEDPRQRVQPEQDFRHPAQV